MELAGCEWQDKVTDLFPVCMADPVIGLGEEVMLPPSERDYWTWE